jgi:hypothetical protein
MPAGGQMAAAGQKSNFLTVLAALRTLKLQRLTPLFDAYFNLALEARRGRRDEQRAGGTCDDLSARVNRCT